VVFAFSLDFQYTLGKSYRSACRLVYQELKIDEVKLAPTAVLALIYSAGLRGQEVVNLRISDTVAKSKALNPAGVVQHRLIAGCADRSESYLLQAVLVNLRHCI
jgi:site-specific recombinase XerD